eukprot:14527432-Ditylum_brightwellii.AAC.1
MDVMLHMALPSAWVVEMIGCSITVPGKDNIEALLEINFGLQATCGDSIKNELALEKGNITFGPLCSTNSFKASYCESLKENSINMSLCKDRVVIKETYPTTSSVIINDSRG